MKTKKSFIKRFLVVFSFILIIFIIWFFIFNYIQIRNGRGVEHSEIISNKYVSDDREVSLNIVDEDSIKIKILIDDENNLYYLDVLSYEFKEGTLKSEKTLVKEKEKNLLFIFLDKETIYFYTYNKYLYLNE